MKKIIALILLAMTFTGVSGRGHNIRHRYYSPRVYVQRTVTVNKTSNVLSSDDRKKIAVAYLRYHKFMTAHNYAKLTGLDKRIAETELESFALDQNIPITAYWNGNKRVYRLI